MGTPTRTDCGLMQKEGFFCFWLSQLLKYSALFTSDKFQMVYDERLQGVPMETIPLQDFDKSYSYQFEWISREERLFYAKLNRLAKNMINFEQNDIRIQKKPKRTYNIIYQSCKFCIKDDCNKRRDSNRLYSL